MKKTFLLAGASTLLLFGLAGCGSDQGKDSSDNSNNASKEEQEAGKANEEKEKEDEKKDDDGGALETKDFKVTMEQAVKDFQKNNPDAKLVEVKLAHSDVDDYHYRVYGIKGKDIYREKINANDGKADDTFHLPMMTKEQKELPKETFTLDGVKDPKEAITQAMKDLKESEGLKDGHVAEWKLFKDEKGTLVYDLRVRDVVREYHIVLDAKNLNKIYSEKNWY